MQTCPKSEVRFSLNFPQSGLALAMQKDTNLLVVSSENEKGKLAQGPVHQGGAQRGWALPVFGSETLYAGVAAAPRAALNWAKREKNSEGALICSLQQHSNPSCACNDTLQHNVIYHVPVTYIKKHFLLQLHLSLHDLYIGHRALLWNIMKWNSWRNEPVGKWYD